MAAGLDAGAGWLDTCCAIALCTPQNMNGHQLLVPSRLLQMPGHCSLCPGCKGNQPALARLGMSRCPIVITSTCTYSKLGWARNALVAMQGRPPPQHSVRGSC